MPRRPTADAAKRIPDRPTLSHVREAARDCKACDLWKRGTQTVFGEGARKAELMLGRLLDRALQDAGIDRAAVYVTNVVEHFKWEPRGKPRVIVCLGATAAQTLIAPAFKVTQLHPRSFARPTRRAAP